MKHAMKYWFRYEWPILMFLDYSMVSLKTKYFKLITAITSIATRLAVLYFSGDCPFKFSLV